MQCPACRQGHLQSETLEANLQTAACGACGGHWVRAYQYWKWRETLSGNHPPIGTDESPGASDSDTGPGKLCPECGSFLQHRKVGHGVAFHLDRCGRCGGIWFDRDEWDALKQRQLHDDVHYIFSEAWQARVREAEQEKAHEQRLRQILGDADYQKAREIRDWLRHHPARATLHAYLQSERQGGASDDANLQGG